MNLENLGHMRTSALKWTCGTLGMLALALTACQPQMPPPPPPTVVDSTDGPHRLDPNLPDGFDIAVAGALHGDTLALEVSLDIPEGSYVISALSDRDYMGKFQVHWSDSTVVPAGNLSEQPASTPGWEPWDRVYTPMMFEPTVVQQNWVVPTGMSLVQGEVLFVLEPQCVLYGLDFEYDAKTGVMASGIVGPRSPD